MKNIKRFSEIVCLYVHIPIAFYQVNTSLFWGNQTLTLTPDYVEHQSGRKPLVRWSKSEVADIRSMKSLIKVNANGADHGEQYFVSLRHSNGTEINVRFWNFLHLKSEYPGIYVRMLDDIKEYYIDDLITKQLTRINAHEAVEIGRLLISLEKIAVSGTGLSFAWSDLTIESYKHFFILIKRSAPEFKFKMIFGEWHSEVTYQLIKRIFIAHHNSTIAKSV